MQAGLGESGELAEAQDHARLFRIDLVEAAGGPPDKQQEQDDAEEKFDRRFVVLEAIDDFDDLLLHLVTALSPLPILHDLSLRIRKFIFPPQSHQAFIRRVIQWKGNHNTAGYLS